MLSAEVFGSEDNIDLGLDNSWYHAQPHSIIVYCFTKIIYAMTFLSFRLSRKQSSCALNIPIPPFTNYS